MIATHKLPPLSVLIRLRNEANFVGRALQSCIDTLKSEIEFVIVDNMSTDDSLKIVNMFKHDTDLPPNSNYAELKVVTIKDYTPGKALNIGVKAATHDFILVLSSHCELTSFPEDLYKMSQSYAGIFGGQTPIFKGKRLTKRYLWSHFNETNPIVNMYSDLESRYFFHNAISFFRKEALEKYPFDEQLVGKEDRYWAAKVVESGANYIYHPGLSCLHHYTQNGNTWKGVG